MKFFEKFKSYILQKLSTMPQRYMGFTLAEVLITLGIIGIVAAVTIPTLINTYEDIQYKSAYKKAFSVLSQALIEANGQNITVNVNTGGIIDTTNFLAIMPQFVTIKECTSNNNSLCWDSSGELFGLDYSSGYPIASYPSFIDKSGMAWTLISGSEGRIAVDINGFKKPNQWGKDRFVFLLVDNNGGVTGLPAKIIPWSDNSANVCVNNKTKCGTVGDPDYHTYYGTSWLYN